MQLLHHAGQASLPPSSLLAPSCLLAYSMYGVTAPLGRLRATARGCPIVVKATTVRSDVLHSTLHTRGRLCPLSRGHVEVQGTTTRHDTTLSILLHPVRRLPAPRSSTPAPALSPLSIPTMLGVSLLITILLLPIDPSSCFRMYPRSELRYQTLWPATMRSATHTPQTDTHIQRRPHTSRSTEGRNGAQVSTGLALCFRTCIVARLPPSFVSQGLVLG